jgi:hypothetical protein
MPRWLPGAPHNFDRAPGANFDRALGLMKTSIGQQLAGRWGKSALIWHSPAAAAEAVLEAPVLAATRLACDGAPETRPGQTRVC